MKWILPEGKILTSKDNITFHPDTAGRYFFTLELLDEEGNWNSTTIKIDVLDIEEPSVEFYIDPAPADLNRTYLSGIQDQIPVDIEDINYVFIVNVTYRFLITKSEDPSGIAFINWTFGDGSKAHGGSVYHNYSKPGIYPVSLFVDDIFGNRFREDMIVLVLPTVNHTMIPIQPYQDVYENVTPEKDDEGRRIVPVTAGILSIAGALIFIVAIIVVELKITFLHIRRRSIREGDR
jgi:hypothetical protein